MTHQNLVNELWENRHSRSLLLPVKMRVHEFTDSLLQVLFPHFSTVIYNSADELDDQLRLLEGSLQSVLRPLSSRMPVSVEETTETFFSRLPDIIRTLRLDAEAISAGDPASESIDEVISAYPGFLAIAIFRFAHEFYSLRVPIFPRIMTEHSHQLTGIDIHPGATVGKSFFIDHGTGIVVGETSHIGDNVKLYQGVTLGALSVSKSLSSTKRHPTIEDNVVIYSNATILGGETVIGHDSVIGGNVWLTESVDPFSVVYHKSEINVRNTRSEHEIINFSI
jgi:serine O-acetyltransferase